MSTEQAATGVVYLIGAGPGDPGLLTLRGAELLGRAEVVVYDGLVHPRHLDRVPAAAERIYAGKKHAPGNDPLTQAEINQLLVARARAGKRVVRLKGGDSFVFGRGAEECEALQAAGVRFEIVPGVTAATAVPAYAGIPLTARSLSSTVAFATGHEAAGKPTSEIDWEALARAGTVVLFMALRTIEDCCRQLVDAGRDAATPAAAIYWGTTAAQRTVTATLGDLPEVAAGAGLKPPVLIIVGDVVRLRPMLSWYERRPLFGARVLIPRGLDQARGFARVVAELGAEPVIMPVTRIAPATGPAAERAVDRAVAGLADYHWVLFTSANSVARFFDELWARDRDARALGRARVAAVGRATARALRERGVIADLVPPRGDGAALAEAVLGAPGPDGGHDGQGESLRVLLPRAVRGRDEAIDALRRAGAHVDLVPVYATEPTPADDPTIQRGLGRLRDRGVDIVAFFAPSQVSALCDLLGDQATELLRACRVIAAIGDTTRAALTERGVDAQVVAAQPDAERLARDIADYYSHARSEPGESSESKET